MQISGALVCLAYLLGLLATGIPGKVQGLPVGSVLLLCVGAIAGLVLPRWNRSLPKSRVWILAALIGFAAGLYFDWRMPEASKTDISRYGTIASPVTITGKIISTPRLTRSEKVQFELEVSDLAAVPRSNTPQRDDRSNSGKANSSQGNSGKGNSGDRCVGNQCQGKSNRSSVNSSISQAQNASAQPAPASDLPVINRPITGKIYVTVPNDRENPFYPNRIYPGQTIAVTGELYMPRPAGNPGGFNFSQYLRRNGIFTGIRGETIAITGNASPPIFWSIRRRIVAVQTAGAGERTGALLSAIVVGRRGVDVPFDIQDAFARVGLAHVLAASGFQVTLLIGVILSLTEKLPAKARFAVGLSTLIFYVGLTGAEAPAVRAGIMGGTVLLAIMLDRKVKILPVLLFAATTMLLCDPLSIWDLGFQMSFLATLGLVVTVPVGILQSTPPICNSLHQFAIRSTSFYNVFTSCKIYAMTPSISHTLERWSLSKFKRYIDEGRGLGEGRAYLPWHRVEEFSSEGRAHRPPGWKTEKRVHQLFSDIENRFFLLCEWSDKVLDIREQYPLRDYELAMGIARDMGMEYPLAQDGTPWIFTTDFMLTIRQGDQIKQIARTIKPVSKLSKKIVSLNFELERRYYAHLDIDWDVITEKKIPRNLADNLEWIHNDYWLEDEGLMSAEDLRAIANTLKIRLQTKGLKIYQVTEQLDEELNLKGSGTSLRLFRHLLARKEIHMKSLDTKISGYLLTDNITNIVPST